MIKIYYKNKLFTKAKVYKSILKQSRGLMFTKKLKKNQSLLLPTKDPLTMLFVFYPIDIVFLNNSKIVDIKKAKPFTPFIFSKQKYNQVLELPRDKSNKIKIGEHLEIFK